MGSLLQCLLRSCFDDEEEEQRRNESYEPPRQVPAASRMSRNSSYQSQEQETTGPDDICCHRDSSAEAAEEDSPHARFVQDFFRLLRDRWRKYEFVDSHDDDRTASNSESSLLTPRDIRDPDRPFGVTRRSSSSSANGRNTSKKNRGAKSLVVPHSPLRTAVTYDQSQEVPSICPEEVVLPGSELQLQMAQSMSEVLEVQGDECIICMEPFDPSNPRMPTLCGCGENRTYFHLPCLYQWMEQSKYCPSCRQQLRWEEF